MEPNLNPSGMEIMGNGIATEKREHRKKTTTALFKTGFWRSGEDSNLRTAVI